jgi:Domain of unknown function (DUF4062)
MLNVFLSSTGRDLREYREAVYQAVQRMDRAANHRRNPLKVLVGALGLEPRTR